MSTWNYFNYFTEIEEYFWKKRGSHLLVSPLDWAIMETWQKAGVPLESVFKGIDRAFESYARSRRGSAGKPLKSLAYCTDAVLEAAEEAQEAAAGKASSSSAKQSAEPFSRDELKKYFARNSAMLRSAISAHQSRPALVALWEESLRGLANCSAILDTPGHLDLEDLERRLTLLDDRIHSALLLHAGDELLLRLRREMDSALSAYRRKMKPEQLALVEKQYLQKRLLEEFRLPRFSLFYLS